VSSSSPRCESLNPLYAGPKYVSVPEKGYQIVTVVDPERRAQDIVVLRRWERG